MQIDDIKYLKIQKRRYNMQFVKGMLIGGIVTAGIAMVYAETMGQNKRKIMKKGKQMAKRMGIM